MITLAVAPLDAYGFAEPTPKDPQAVQTFAWDWRPFLDDLEGTDEVRTFDVMASTPSLTVNWSASDGRTVQARVSGGSAGTKARLRCRVTTRLGRSDTRSIHLCVVDR